MIFNVSIVSHTTPAVSVNVADSSGVTYNQIKQSLGSQVYDVEGLYLYSDNISQLTGVIKYQRYDVTGNQNVTNIVTTIDPYQDANSLIIDLQKTATPIVLNGNSSVATVILPNTYLQLKFLAKRITSSFELSLFNFKEMDRITRSKFFENYGASIDDIQATNQAVMDSMASKSISQPLVAKEEAPAKKDFSTYYVVGGIVVASVAVLLIVNNIKYIKNAFQRS